MKRNKVLMIVMIVLCICNWTLKSSAQEETDPLEEAKTKIKSMLNEDEFVAFQNVRTAVNRQDKKAVCGEVKVRYSDESEDRVIQFNVSGVSVNIVDPENNETGRLYNLAGCAGPEAELETWVEGEAFFNCTIIWELLDKVVLQEKDKEAAIDEAVEATNKRVQANGFFLSGDEVEMMHVQYRGALDQTLNDQDYVEMIKQDPKLEEKKFVASCMAMTIDGFKEKNQQ